MTGLRPVGVFGGIRGLWMPAPPPAAWRDGGASRLSLAGCSPAEPASVWPAGCSMGVSLRKVKSGGVSARRRAWARRRPRASAIRADLHRRFPC